MKITFDAQTHTYHINGIKVPHVTGIIEEAGLTDYSGIPADRLDIAREFGTAVHKACELYDRGILNESILDSKLKPYLDGWRKFLADTGFKPEIIEGVIGSEKYMFGAIIDRRGVLKEKITIVEIKSTYNLGVKATAIQTAGQLIAHNENYKHEKATQRMAVLLKPDGNYTPHYFKQSNDMNVFLACLTVTNYRRLKS